MLTGFEPLPEMCIAAQQETESFKAITILTHFMGLLEFDYVAFF